jgi:signal transduction histidine kinase
LLRDLGAFARPLKLNLEPTQLASFLTVFLAGEQRQLASKSIRVDLDLTGALPLVLVDRLKFKQVLRNLCKNAVEAMPHGGTLTVRASESAEAIWLEIEDTGTGIPSGLNVFELFTTTKAEGTGLGLAVVLKIVAAHGGRITYKSEERKGTTFCVSLPKTLVVQEQRCDSPRRSKTTSLTDAQAKILSGTESFITRRPAANA